MVCTLLLGCKPDPVLPTVETSAVTEITQTTATTGGTITSDGGAEITSRGVCWSTNQNPTINDMLTSNGSGVGTFASSIENLLANTTYYVRAYATNSEGTAYGENFCFVTLEEDNDGDDNGGDDNGGDDDGEIDVVAPTVVTLSASCVSFNAVSIGGEVTADGGAEVTTRGFYVE